jgi:hypothetical protein
MPPPAAAQTPPQTTAPADPQRDGRRSTSFTPPAAHGGSGNRFFDGTTESRRQLLRATSPAAARTRTQHFESAKHQRPVVHRDGPQAPRKLYVYCNEAKAADPVIVMMPAHMTLPALKSKVGALLGLKPFGQLHTVDGGLVRAPLELQHCQEVVATKHAGAPFDLHRLPHLMQFAAPAAGAPDMVPFA